MAPALLEQRSTHCFDEVTLEGALGQQQQKSLALVSRRAGALSGQNFARAIVHTIDSGSAIVPSDWRASTQVTGLKPVGIVRSTDLPRPIISSVPKAAPRRDDPIIAGLRRARLIDESRTQSYYDALKSDLEADLDD